MLIQASSELTGIQLFREQGHYLRSSVWCDDCRTLWLSDGEVPEKHRVVKVHDVVFKEQNYVDKIYYLECKRYKII